MFLPFHHGSWDEDPGSHRWPRGANELRRLYPMAHDCEIGWVLLGEAGHAARDEGLKALAEAALPEKEVQIRWLKTTLRESAVQLLVFS
ncbi:hypothetical protein [Sorangium sp. So ce693]|uniref:hypothetical protein n=1 Tax=Sorangium sp. So ce693 TaxID=3133318 RepID=UPI003F612C42